MRQGNHEDLAKHEDFELGLKCEEKLNDGVDIENLSKALQQIGNQLCERTWFDRTKEELSRSLEFVKERLQRELAISKGLRKTTEKLQDEKKRLETTSTTMQDDVLELREKVHELEKANKSFQQKLKRTEKELERLQLKEIGEYAWNIYELLGHQFVERFVLLCISSR